MDKKERIEDQSLGHALLVLGAYLIGETTLTEIKELSKKTTNLSEELVELNSRKDLNQIIANIFNSEKEIKAQPVVVVKKEEKIEEAPAVTFANLF